MTGFTGVVWEARPAQQLAADLVDGAGPVPTADAALGWGHVAAVLTDAGLDYAAILSRLGISWESVTSDQAFAKLADFAAWFTEATAAAVENAGKASAQCAALTVARTNMPNLPEIAVTEGIRDTAAAVGTALGAPIGGVAADAERALHDQKQRAARVMDTYESASAPLAQPWLPPVPGQVVSGKALADEQMSRTCGGSTPAMPPVATVTTGAPLVGGFVPGVGAAPREKTRFASTVLAGSTSPTAAMEPSVQTAPHRASTSTTPAPPMAPLATGGAEPVRTTRASSGAGIDTAATTQDENDWLRRVHDDAGEKIDARYRTGTLDLPPATSVPAVLGAPDGEL